MYALLLPLLAPWLVIVLLGLPRLRAVAERLAPTAPIPALILALGAPPDARLELPGVLLGTTLGLDSTGRTFLLFTAFVWWLAGWFARGWLRSDRARVRFWVYFLGAEAGSLGLCLAQDVVSFYLLFALMTFAAYGLVVHRGDDAARRAGRVYLSMAMVGEVMLFAGIAIRAGAIDSARFDDLVSTPISAMAAGLLIVGFGIKTGLPLLHLWLPLAHPVAPVPASAVLSGVMLKAGVLGWLRFLPIGEVVMPAGGSALMVLGIAAMFFGVALGVVQRDLKVLLAYSSVSQMGFLSLGVGAGLVAPELWPWLGPAILAYAFHHALAKSALFLGAGLVRMHGGRPWILAGLALPALALAGAPLTSGMFAKMGLKAALVQLSPPWPAVLAWLLPLAATGTALLMARLLWLAAHKTGEGTVAGVNIPWLLLLTGVLLVAEWGRPAWPETAAYASALLPLLLAVPAGMFAAKFNRRLPVIPPGDLIVPIERLAISLHTQVQRLRYPGFSSLPTDRRRYPFRIERRLRHWTTATVLWLLVLALVLIALVPGLLE
ncbi:MAG: complex I subunit 5 family protein [Thiotrichales bacterium]